MNHPLLVGLTGGIGAGKTICANIFRELNIPIYGSDEEAKRLMVDDQEVVTAIKKEFGTETYYEDGSLNRAHLSRIIFEDERKLSNINGIVHPAVRQDFIHWASTQMHAPYIIQESALLIEIGAQDFFDKIILVDAPEEIRMQRVMDRDNVSKSEVKARMFKQLSSAEKRKVADFIIENDGHTPLIRQILEIHMELLIESDKMNTNY